MYLAVEIWQESGLTKSKFCEREGIYLLFFINFVVNRFFVFKLDSMKNEIIIYQTNELSMHFEVRLEDETVWLNRHQMAELFDRDVKTIGKHINNVFKEGELEKSLVVAKFATTTQHGAIKGKTQTIQVEYYNLDVIISVGYRVKSKRGTQFRIWANNVLKDYLLKGYSVNKRIDRIDLIFTL